eukprot:3549138-Amphidinium_carterae.1
MSRAEHLAIVAEVVEHDADRNSTDSSVPASASVSWANIPARRTWRPSSGTTKSCSHSRLGSS